jgi:two-component system nitrate/nitrite response regulator NarL
MDASLAVRVVVADPLPVFRYGLRRVLDSSGNIQIVGEAAHAAQAVEEVRRLDPDVLVLTIEHGQSGLDAMLALSEVRSRVRCIVLTNRDEFPAGLAAAPPSIGCVLPRTSTGRDLIHCVDCVLKHQCWPEPHGRIQCAPARPQAEPGGPSRATRRYGLTQRESQIVAAVAEGGTNKDIAAQLTISEDTVKHHMSNIFDKMGVHSRLELAVFALYHKVVDTGTEHPD